MGSSAGLATKDMEIVRLPAGAAYIYFCNYQLIFSFG